MHSPPWFSSLLITASLLCQGAAAALDTSSQDALKKAASQNIYGMLTYYHGNETGQIPGAFPEKWWEGAPLMEALVKYWHFTGDDQYNEELTQGLSWQGGENGDYLPSNYSRFLGNDDQMFWGLAALTAAELKLPDTKPFSWLSLGQGVFNTQKARWDADNCGGGLRWQLFPYQGGYNMKNTISNGGFFQVAARLYRYTGDKQYLDWSNKMWDWLAGSGLLNTKTWNVADSIDVPECGKVGNAQWSYNYGTLLSGAAYLYDATSGADKDKWGKAVDGLLGVILQKFFPSSDGGIFQEISCEKAKQCNNNEVLFKGVTSTWLSFTALLVPDTYEKIMPALAKSAAAAVASCSGPQSNICGVMWFNSKFDGQKGMEQQISVADVILANMVQFDKKLPVTSKTGGNSKSNTDAGKDHDLNKSPMKPITTGDKVGAVFATLLVIGGWTALIVWVMIEAGE